MWPIDPLDGMRSSIQKRFPQARLSSLPGGGTNTCFMLNDNGLRTVVKVAMVSEAGASVEKACIGQLYGSGYAPRLFGSFRVEKRTALHMEFVEGRIMLERIIEYSLKGEVQDILPLFTELGEVLAGLHHLPVEREGLEEGWTIPEIQLSLPDPQICIEPALTKRSEELVGRLERINPRQVLLHGDYGYHNLLIRDNGACCLLDWELAGFGHPGMDIGNVLFWTHLHFPEIAGSCIREFRKGYGAGEGNDSADLLHAFVILQLWRMIALVRPDFKESVKKEWNRRLAWALDHSFL